MMQTVTESKLLEGTSWRRQGGIVTTYGYDRAGRRTSTTDAAGTHAFTYDDTTNGGGQPATWSVTGSGAWAGLSVGYGLTSGRRSSRSTSLGGITLPGVGYTYDPASGRMATVSSGGITATYGYDAATGWYTGVSYTGGPGSTRTPDGLGRLSSIAWSAGGTTVSSHGYTVIDTRGRRKTAQRQDGSAWSYGYNDRGEVTSAAKKDATSTFEPGKQFAFDYDGLGNRTSSSVSSIADATVLRTTGYTPNALNQYDSITHPQPGWLVLRGSILTTAGNSVTIDGNAPTLTAGSLWFHEQSVDNSGGNPIKQMVNISATRPDGGVGGGPVTTTQKGVLYIPPSTESPIYDLDGNLTSDARWNYTWDGENRLIAVEEKTGIAAQPTGATVTRKRLEFSYDARGRRISKSVFVATGSGSFVLQQSLVCLYDGWNMIAEIDTTSAQLLRSYEWGMDVSGTMTGAGGVGGLLVERFYTAPASGTYAPCYDGNGNVTELVNLANGSVSARYEYGAFGETISVDGGAVASANPMRFSTKYLDVETGLYNYGHRLYDPPNARWLNRDPIEEQGGINLYGMVENNPVNEIDPFGLDKHHWFSRLGGVNASGVSPGQQLIWSKFPTLCLNIHDYTTQIDGVIKGSNAGTPHQFLHSNTISYNELYLAVIASSKTPCQFVVSMQLVMQACHNLLRLVDKFGGFQRGGYKAPILKLETYGSGASTNMKYFKMMIDACHSEGAPTPAPVAVKFKNDVAEFEMRLNSLATARALPGVPFPRFRPIQSPGIYPIPGELDPSLFDTMDPKLMLAAAALAAVVVADDGTVVGVGDDLPGLAKALEMLIRGLQGARYVPAPIP